MTKTNSPNPTRIYLLAVWQEGVSTRLTLRFSLEDPRTGERQGFNSPQALVDYFEAAWVSRDENDSDHG